MRRHAVESTPEVQAAGFPMLRGEADGQRSAVLEHVRAIHHCQARSTPTFAIQMQTAAQPSFRPVREWPRRSQGSSTSSSGGASPILRRDGDNPYVAIGSDIFIGSHDHGRPAFGVAALRVFKFNPNDAAAAEWGHGVLPSERLAFIRIIRGRRPALRPNSI